MEKKKKIHIILVLGFCKHHYSGPQCFFTTCENFRPTECVDLSLIPCFFFNLNVHVYSSDPSLKFYGRFTICPFYIPCRPKGVTTLTEQNFCITVSLYRITFIVKQTVLHWSPNVPGLEHKRVLRCRVISV